MSHHRDEIETISKYRFYRIYNSQHVRGRFGNDDDNALNILSWNTYIMIYRQCWLNDEYKKAINTFFHISWTNLCNLLKPVSIIFIFMTSNAELRGPIPVDINHEYKEYRGTNIMCKCRIWFVLYKIPIQAYITEIYGGMCDNETHDIKFGIVITSIEWHTALLRVSNSVQSTSSVQATTINCDNINDDTWLVTDHW